MPPKVPEDYLAFIESDRVAPNTRDVLLARIPDPTDAPHALAPDELATLRAVLARIIPQLPGHEIDLAARIDQQLAAGKGDGWRFAVLPPDAAAYKLGLAFLNQPAAFSSLLEVEQDVRIQTLSSHPTLPKWFSDLRAEAAAAWVAHPATLARLACSSPGVGGANTPHRGFTQIGVGDVEPWEPR